LTHFLALLGVLSISFSAVFIRLARVSPVAATFYRAVYAMPVLAVILLADRRRRAGDAGDVRDVRDVRSRREHVLAFLSGLFLAADLDLWHESIALVGAGLGTVIPNVQIVFVAIVAWMKVGDRPRARTIVMIGVVLAGVALTSGLGRAGAYGTTPGRGVALGVAAGLCYAIFLIVFRASNRGLVPPAAPLLEATAGMAIGALLSAGFDPGFTFAVSREAHLWLLALALVSQVMGWLLIATALPRLPAVETSVLLLVQPVFAIAWGVMFFAERLSSVQWLGSAIVLAGVAVLSLAGVTAVPAPAARSPEPGA
jgi:drug/metabolite transporter (DMT)-like permease